MFSGTNEELDNIIKEKNSFILYIENEKSDLIDVFEKLSKKYTNYKFIIVNLNTLSIENIKATPTIRLYQNGEMSDEYSGNSTNKLEFFIIKNFVQTINSHNEFNNIVNNYQKLVAVDFTATWCGPCKRIGPTFNSLNEKYKNVIFVKVDVDENEETSEQCNVRSMPTFQFYKNSKKVFEFSGADKQKLEESIEKYN